MLLHSTKKPLRKIISKTQDAVNEDMGAYTKPDGLWVSVEGEQDWKEWCEAESFNLPGLTKEYEIALTANAKILTLCSKKELLDFSKKYGHKPHPQLDHTGIYWHKVAENLQGIIIAPYVWECRLEAETSWYYGWDCASGCIWDATAIQSFKLRV